MSDTELNRRGLFLGGGAAVAAGAFAYGTQPADATPSPHGDGTESPTVRSNGSPITGTIASQPVSGWTYRTVDMYDFKPFDPSARFTWGGSGTYTAGSAGTLRASVEIPAGALVREVEYYVYNSSTNSTAADAYLYVPGGGFISSIGASVTVPAGASSISAYRAVTTSTTWGPYPVGARLLVSVQTAADGSQQVNGVRVGFSGGAGTTGLLDAPIRAYDSRTSGGKLAAGTTRTVTLPSSVVVPGTTGAILNVTAVGATAAGYLTVYSAAVGQPTASSINYRGDGSAIANGMTVAVSNARQIKIFAYSAVHVIVDVTGVIA